jgi:hypothetical protein
VDYLVDFPFNSIKRISIAHDCLKSFLFHKTVTIPDIASFMQPPSPVMRCTQHNCIWLSFSVTSSMLVWVFFITSITLTVAIYCWKQEPSWPWSYGSWIYLCNQCLSPLMLWVRIWIRSKCTTLCDQVCQWLATGRWFSPGPPVSPTNKTDRHDITEILLKVAFSTKNSP